MGGSTKWFGCKCEVGGSSLASVVSLGLYHLAGCAGGLFFVCSGGWRGGKILGSSDCDEKKNNPPSVPSGQWGEITRV